MKNHSIDADESVGSPLYCSSSYRNETRHDAYTDKTAAISPSDQGEKDYDTASSALLLGDLDTATSIEVKSLYDADETASIEETETVSSVDFTLAYGLEGTELAFDKQLGLGEIVRCVSSPRRSKRSTASSRHQGQARRKQKVLSLLIPPDSPLTPGSPCFHKKKLKKHGVVRKAPLFRASLPPLSDDADSVASVGSDDSRHRRRSSSKDDGTDDGPVFITGQRNDKDRRSAALHNALDRWKSERNLYSSKNADLCLSRSAHNTISSRMQIRNTSNNDIVTDRWSASPTKTKMMAKSTFIPEPPFASTPIVNHPKARGRRRECIDSPPFASRRTESPSPCGRVARPSDDCHTGDRHDKTGDHQADSNHAINGQRLHQQQLQSQSFHTSHHAALGRHHSQETPVRSY